MENIITINDHQAQITFNPETGMYRGEFIGLNGGADFYAHNVDDLRNEGAISLRVYLAGCEKRGLQAYSAS